MDGSTLLTRLKSLIPNRKINKLQETDHGTGTQHIFFENIDDICKQIGVEYGNVVRAQFLGTQSYFDFARVHMSTVTPERLIPSVVQPTQGNFDWSAVDPVINNFSDRKLIGHTLVWNHPPSQTVNFQPTPTWMKTGTSSQIENAVLNHIDVVMQRYAANIKEWHVVNEAVSDDPAHDFRQNEFYNDWSNDYVNKSFQQARANDGSAKLWLADFNLINTNKVDRAIRVANTAPDCDGIVMQGHLRVDQMPSKTVMRQNIQKVFAAGYYCKLGEVDIRIFLGSDKQPTEKQLQDQAQAYVDVFRVAIEEGVTEISLWLLSDFHSWIPNFFPSQGAAGIVAYDQNTTEFTPKLAYSELKKMLASKARAKYPKHSLRVSGPTNIFNKLFVSAKTVLQSFLDVQAFTRLLDGLRVDGVTTLNGFLDAQGASFSNFVDVGVNNVVRLGQEIEPFAFHGTTGAIDRRPLAILVLETNGDSITVFIDDPQSASDFVGKFVNNAGTLDGVGFTMNGKTITYQKVADITVSRDDDLVDSIVKKASTTDINVKQTFPLSGDKRARLSLNTTNPIFENSSGQLDVKRQDPITLNNKNLSVKTKEPVYLNNGQLDVRRTDPLTVNTSNQLTIDTANVLFTNSGQLDLRRTDPLTTNGSNQLTIDTANVLFTNSGKLDLRRTGPLTTNGSNQLTVDANNPLFTNNGSLDIRHTDPLYVNPSNQFDLRVNNPLFVNSGSMDIRTSSNFTTNSSNQLDLDKPSVDGLTVNTNAATVNAGLQSNGQIQVAFKNSISTVGSGLNSSSEHSKLDFEGNYYPAWQANHKSTDAYLRYNGDQEELQANKDLNVQSNRVIAANTLQRFFDIYGVNNGKLLLSPAVFAFKNVDTDINLKNNEMEFNSLSNGDKFYKVTLNMNVRLGSEDRFKVDIKYAKNQTQSRNVQTIKAIRDFESHENSDNFSGYDFTFSQTFVVRVKEGYSPQYMWFEKASSFSLNTAENFIDDLIIFAGPHVLVERIV